MKSAEVSMVSVVQWDDECWGFYGKCCTMRWWVLIQLTLAIDTMSLLKWPDVSLIMSFSRVVLYTTNTETWL